MWVLEVGWWSAIGAMLSIMNDVLLCTSQGGHVKTVVGHTVRAWILWYRTNSRVMSIRRENEHEHQINLPLELDHCGTEQKKE